MVTPSERTLRGLLRIVGGGLVLAADVSGHTRRLEPIA